MGVLRNRLGAKEDQFLATAFLGSGLLFVVSLFSAAAIAAGLLEALADGRILLPDSEAYYFGRRTVYMLLNVFAFKMAAVFMFSTGTIGLRTGFLPRWVALVGYACGLVLLVVITELGLDRAVVPSVGPAGQHGRPGGGVPQAARGHPGRAGAPSSGPGRREHQRVGIARQGDTRRTILLMARAAKTQLSRRNGAYAWRLAALAGLLTCPTVTYGGEAMMKRRTYDHEILLLQGGGALGAYHCGVYEGLAEVGVTPNWFVGISIGAVNSAIMAGNPPERRLDRLRTFWDRASAFSTFDLPACLEPMRPMLGKLNFATVATWGIPGFFKPRRSSPTWLRAAARTP